MITNYGELKAEIATYLYNRKDLTASIETFIALGEKKIFRKLRCRANEVLVADDLTADRTGFELPTDFLEMKFIEVSGVPLERKSEIEYMAMSRTDSAGGVPIIFARIVNDIKFWREADDDYDYSYVYWQTQEGLMTQDEDVTPVLTFAPDLYLFASLIEAMPFIVKDERLPVWQQMFASSLEEIDYQTKESEYAGSPVSVSSPYSDPVRGTQRGRGY